MLKEESLELWFILNLPASRKSTKIMGVNGTVIYTVVQAENPPLSNAFLPSCPLLVPGQKLQ